MQYMFSEQKFTSTQNTNNYDLGKNVYSGL